MNERYDTLLNDEDYIASLGCYVETNTGSRFRLDKPVYEIEVIGHALSMMCRYNGHVRTFYSVAEHSVLVGLLMQELKLGDPKEGLLHDGVESVLADIASPFKPVIPDFKRLDKRLDRALRAQYSLPEQMTDGCREADMLALFIEAWFLMPSRGEGYGDPHNIRPRALELCEQGWRPATLYPPEAVKAFNKAWEQWK